MGGEKVNYFINFSCALHEVFWHVINWHVHFEVAILQFIFIGRDVGRGTEVEGVCWSGHQILISDRYTSR